MERNRHLWVIRLLVLVALAVSLQAKLASAQVFEGKFTVPSEIRWGSATLRAGHYSLKLDTGKLQGLGTVYRGTRPVALILPQSFRDPNSESSAIVVEAGTVRELNLPQLGRTLNFAAQNPTHHAVPEEEQLAQIIPVAAARAGR